MVISNRTCWTFSWAIVNYLLSELYPASRPSNVWITETAEPWELGWRRWRCPSSRCRPRPHTSGKASPSAQKWTCCQWCWQGWAQSISPDGLRRTSAASSRPCNVQSFTWHRLQRKTEEIKTPLKSIFLLIAYFDTVTIEFKKSKWIQINIYKLNM